MDAAGVAAPVRHNPEHFTQSTTTSSTPQTRDDSEAVGVVNRWRVEEDRFLERLGIADADAFTAEVGERCAATPAGRRRGGRGRRWSPPCRPRSKPAAGPRSTPRQRCGSSPPTPPPAHPMRVAEAGPWWDDAAPQHRPRNPSGLTPRGGADELSLEQVEAELAEADGLRVHLQADARQQLRAERQPVTRATVLRRAHQLLQLHRRDAAVAV